MGRRVLTKLPGNVSVTIAGRAAPSHLKGQDLLITPAPPTTTKRTFLGELPSFDLSPLRGETPLDACSALAALMMAVLAATCLWMKSGAVGGGVSIDATTSQPATTCLTASGFSSASPTTYFHVGSKQANPAPLNQ